MSTYPKFVLYGKWFSLICLFAAGSLLSGCDMGPKSGWGFTLPEGDAERGEKLFVELQCIACHEISGRPDLREGTYPEMTVTLGGETSQISTYGQLVTSVINPSHRIAPKYRNEAFQEDGESMMRNYNDIMTVSELTDIVTFVQDQYELDPFTYTQYTPYHP